MVDQPRREKLLDVADRLFRHYGPQKTTMADVARDAGIGVGTVYLEFPSKDALVEALSRRRYRAVLDAMKFASEESGARASQRLAAVLTARGIGFLAMADEGAHACDLLHCGSDPVKSAQSAYHEEERALVAEILRSGADSGELDISDLDTTLRVLLLSYTAFVPPAVLKRDRETFEGDLAAMHALVLNGLLRRPKKRP